MSRAFTKEDRVEGPLFVPRAALPEGVPNYVTRRGLTALRAELSTLDAERARLLAAADGDAPAHLALVDARRAELERRLASAVLVDPTELPRDEVRFSALVTLRAPSGEERRYELVGVDEADATTGRIAFIAPVARELLGRRIGETVTLRGADAELEIAAIAYPSE